MSASWSRRWSALAIALGLVTSVARAEMITPDSISNPPTAVSSTGYGFVYSSNYVTTQYAGMGLNFGGTAISNLNGVPVWVPLGIAVGNPAPAGAIDYAWGLEGNLVSPGSSKPMTVSSLSVETIGLSGTQTVSVNGNGQLQSIDPIMIGGPKVVYGDLVWTFTGTNISAFSISPSPGGPWGVSAIAFTPATVPEPSSLLLAGLGALGLTARWRRRRVRSIA